MSHHIVEVDNLCYAYPDGTAAVQGISFCIHHGESVAIVGANGAGKSTLLQHLNGYLTPGKGRVRIGDFPQGDDPRRAPHRRHGLPGSRRPALHADGL
jgi:cobalt/nickel transport system ATP-binding protein